MCSPFLKGKTKLKESEGTGDPKCDHPSLRRPARPLAAIPQTLVACRNETMGRFAQDVHNLAGGYLNKPVVDSTGLRGAYDFDLKWTPRGRLEGAGSEGISIFDAVDKELGLKLTLATAPQPVFIVDSVNEKPTPNPPDLAKLMPPLPPPQFEVATIKPYKPDEKRMLTIHGDQFDAQGFPLTVYIKLAWQRGYDDLPGAPKWLDEDFFDIHSQTRKRTFRRRHAPRSSEDLYDAEFLQLMLRPLIEDRFQMKDHWENCPVTAYNLIAANPKMALPGRLQSPDAMR